MDDKKRIEILDGFRCICVLMVLFYHFYYRWQIPHTDYKNIGLYFSYGYYGVEFFFIISGFVIFYTLEKSDSFKHFMLKRWIRLFPPMLVCSVITYFFVQYADADNSIPPIHPKTALNFFPSLTFTHPYFWTKLFGNIDIRFMDGAYWSLWVELCFYISAGFLFFYNKEKFVSNWIKLLLPATLLHMLAMPQFYFELSNPVLNFIIDVLRRSETYINICEYITYFTIGIVFYCLYTKKKISVSNLSVCGFFILIQLYFLPDVGVMISFFIIIALFGLFVYKPRYLAFLKHPLITGIGVISYTIYLIHQNVGLVMITRLSSYTQSTFIKALIPLFVVGLFIVFAALSYRFYEKPVSRKLTRMLIKKNVSG